MKFSKYLFLAAGCAMLASCSSDEPFNPGDNQQKPEEAVSGYAKLEIKLPRTSGFSKAPTYEEGQASEYAVNNGKIIVFKKADTEAAATFVCTAELTGMNWNANTSGEITTTSASVAQLSDINLTDNSQYAAVVVLNYNNDFNFPTAGQTFGQWSETAQTGSMILGESLTMTNAAEVKNGQPVILVDIDKTKIAQSESLISGSAATIYVQRATSKVTVVTNSEAYTPTGASYNRDKVTLDAWALDITNKSSYPVQVTSGLNSADNFSDIWSTERFTGGSKFTRAFWAKDPNYNSNITNPAEQFNIIDATVLNGKPTAAYCLENTFDINNMKQGQTTRVVIKGTYVPNSDVTGVMPGENFFKIGASTKLWNADALVTEIIAHAQTVTNDETLTAQLGNIATVAGFHSLSEVTFSKTLEAATLDQIAQKLGLVNANDKGIATYSKGEVFYIARIKHFGDADCPWNIGDPTYGGNNEAYLGRYGMVRNNWYEVNVTSVSNPGSPIVPIINPDMPDDENDYYIQVEINMLAWAKRVQNVDL